MDLAHDAMLVSLRISSWSGRLYDRQASRHVADTHSASLDAGRYNKRLLPKEALAKISAVLSAARTTHYALTLPWDDQNNRLLPVDAYDRYKKAIASHDDSLIAARSTFLSHYDRYIEDARIDLGTLFSHSDYPSPADLRDRFSISARFKAVESADNFIARLAEGETAAIRTSIEADVQQRLHDAVADLYQRLGNAVTRVADRLKTDDTGKPLVFRDTLIGNIRDLLDVMPALNITGDPTLTDLCTQVENRIAAYDPAQLRPSPSFDPALRDQVRRDAEQISRQLADTFAGYFTPPPLLEAAE